MYYVYVLKSYKDGNLYIGQTSNIDRRLRYHNSGRVQSTKKRSPLKLIHVEEFLTRGELLKGRRF